MSYREEANNILRQLGENLDCGILELDENNRVMLSLDGDDLGIVIYADEGEGANPAALIVNIVLGPLSSSDGALLYDLLCANYMWNSTGGGTLAIDEASGVLTLQNMLELPAEYAVFEDLFLHLVGAARYWRQTLEQESTADEVQTSDMLRV